MTRRLLKPVWMVIALLFLLEAWLWDHIQPLVAWIIARLPWREMKAALARGVAKLPPAIVIFLFALPEVLGIPAQLLSLWIVAKGAVVFGTLLFVIAKGLGLLATLVLFEVCHEKLMELAWFRYAYRLVSEARAWAKMQVQPLLDDIARLKLAIKARLSAMKRQGGLWEMLRRLRANAKKRAAR
jgi:hypothetical protein